MSNDKMQNLKENKKARELGWKGKEEVSCWIGRCGSGLEGKCDELTKEKSIAASICSQVLFFKKFVEPCTWNQQKCWHLAKI